MSPLPAPAAISPDRRYPAPGIRAGAANADSVDDTGRNPWNTMASVRSTATGPDTRAGVDLLYGHTAPGQGCLGLDRRAGERLQQIADVVGDVDGVFAQSFHRHDLEGVLVGRGQDDRRGHPVLVGV